MRYEMAQYAECLRGQQNTLISQSLPAAPQALVDRVEMERREINHGSLVGIGRAGAHKNKKKTDGEKSTAPASDCTRYIAPTKCRCHPPLASRDNRRGIRASDLVRRTPRGRLRMPARDERYLHASLQSRSAAASSTCLRSQSCAGSAPAPLGHTASTETGALSNGGSSTIRSWMSRIAFARRLGMLATISVRMIRDAALENDGTLTAMRPCCSRRCGASMMTRSIWTRRRTPRSEKNPSVSRSLFPM